MGCCSSKTAGSQSEHRNVRPVRAAPNQTRQEQFARGLQWAQANRRDPEAVESHIGGWVDGIKQCSKGERGCSSHRCSRHANIPPPATDIGAWVSSVPKQFPKGKGRAHGCRSSHRGSAKIRADRVRAEAMGFARQEYNPREFSRGSSNLGWSPEWSE